MMLINFIEFDFDGAKKQFWEINCKILDMCALIIAIFKRKINFIPDIKLSMN
jgi:hypothetical protein